MELVEKVVFNDPEQNCHIKGRRSDWDGLPPSKSLFTSGKGKGLPIGNLTSQIFANFYLNFLTIMLSMIWESNITAAMSTIL